MKGGGCDMKKESSSTPFIGWSLREFLAAASGGVEGHRVLRFVRLSPLSAQNDTEFVSRKIRSPGICSPGSAKKRREPGAISSNIRLRSEVTPNIM